MYIFKVAFSEFGGLFIDGRLCHIVAGVYALVLAKYSKHFSLERNIGL